MAARPAFKFQFYRSYGTDGEIEWRWRLLAKNGKIIADSGEGYNRQSQAQKQVKKVLEFFFGVPLEDHEALFEVDWAEPPKRRVRKAPVPAR